MTKLENLTKQLKAAYSEQFEMKSFGKYRIELHTPYAVFGGVKTPEFLGVDLYIHNDAEPENAIETEVFWSAVKIFANEDLTKFVPTYSPDKDESEEYVYEERETNDETLQKLESLAYEPEFIESVQKMSKEFIKRLQDRIAKL